MQNDCPHTTDDFVTVCRHCDKKAYTMPVVDDGPTVLTAEMLECAIRKIKAFSDIRDVEPLNLELMVRAKYGDKVYEEKFAPLLTKGATI